MSEFRTEHETTAPEEAAYQVPPAPLSGEVILGIGDDYDAPGEARTAAGTAEYGAPDIDTSDIGFEDGLGGTNAVDPADVLEVATEVSGSYEAPTDELPAHAAAELPEVDAEELVGLAGPEEDARMAYGWLGVDPDTTEAVRLYHPAQAVSFIPVRDGAGGATAMYSLDHEPPAPDSDMDLVVQNYLDRMDRDQDEVHFDNEVALTAQEEQLFQDIVARYSDIADTLGVPEAKGQITQRNHVHIFDKVEDFDAAVVSLGVDPSDINGASGVAIPLTGVLWTRSKDPIDNASGLAHEIAHDIGVISIELDYSGRALPEAGLKTGYYDNKRGINELCCDMLADRAIRPLLGESLMAYKGVDAIGDAIIRSVAGSADPQYVEDELERGYLNGVTTAKVWIEATIGQDAAQLFYDMTGDETLAETLAIAKQMGLPAAVQMIQDMINRKPVRLFAWR